MFVGLEIILFNGENYFELWVGKGEFLCIVKVGLIWEVEMLYYNILMVGEWFVGIWKDYLLMKLEDGVLYDGDEWLCMWWWIKNKLLVIYYIVDDIVINGGYIYLMSRVG